MFIQCYNAGMRRLDQASGFSLEERQAATEAQAMSVAQTYLRELAQRNTSHSSAENIQTAIQKGLDWIRESPLSFSEEAIQNLETKIQQRLASRYHDIIAGLEIL